VDEYFIPEFGRSAIVGISLSRGRPPGAASPLAVDREEDNAMITLALAAAVGSYVLLAAYVLSGPPTTPH
jgi:hypothetical protein